MKVQRHLPPTAAPLSFADLVKGMAGLLCPDRTRARLESELKSYFGVRHIFLLTSGKAALAMILNGLKAGSSRCQVIIPAYTCYSVPSAVHKAGLEVVLCDVDPHSLDFDPAGLRAVVGENTLAIVAPHLFGQPADLKGSMPSPSRPEHSSSRMRRRRWEVEIRADGLAHWEMSGFSVSGEGRMSQPGQGE